MPPQASRNERRSDTTTASLGELLDCPVLLPGDPGFADGISGFNLATTHTPDLVVAATSTADVPTAVRWAAAQDMPIAVQATGHGASAAVDSGLLISTRRMNGVDVDPAASTAMVASASCPMPRSTGSSSTPEHPVPAEEGSLLLRELPAAALDTILELAGPEATTPLLFLMLRHMGGALSRPSARDQRHLAASAGVADSRLPMITAARRPVA